MERLRALFHLPVRAAFGMLWLLAAASISHTGAFGQTAFLTPCPAQGEQAGFLLPDNAFASVDGSLSHHPSPSASLTGMYVPLHPLPVTALLADCERLTWQDKRRHFLLSAAFTGSGYLLLRRGAGLSKRSSLAISVGAVAAIGVAKELYDKKNGDPPCFSRLDILANGLGILTAAGLILIL